MKLALEARARQKNNNVVVYQLFIVEAVKFLGEKHSLWIMSDTDPLHFTFLLNNYPLLRSADRHYLSFEHGWMKSSVEAFSHVLESSGRNADEFILD